MNYYENHIGDYLKDTAHLSLLEHGVYKRLMDVYYTRETPLPDDVARLIGARSKDEKTALASVLQEFFVKHADGYHQTRCDAEIARYQDKQAKAKRSAEARWGASRAQSDGNANASADGMRTHSEGNALQAPDTNNQTPDTKHQEHAQAPTVSTGDACKAMKAAGLAEVNPSNPRLMALLQAGITLDELRSAAADAVGRTPPKGFAYALATAEGRRRDGAVAPLPGARGPRTATGETTYQRSMRERMQAVVPSIAARAPGSNDVIETEAHDVTPRRLG